MIKVVQDRGRRSPVVECDCCGELVEAEMGLATWLMKDNQLCENGKVYFVHKACDSTFKTGDPNSDWRDTELTCFLRDLIWNTNTNIEETSGSEMLRQLP